MAPEIPQDHAVWGNFLGKGAARCFRILGEQVDGDAQLQVIQYLIEKINRA